jgi:hypothetical protein
MRAHDEQRYPGGPNTGFLIWLPLQLSQWRVAAGIRFDHPLDDDDQAAFDIWLETA